MTQMGHPADLRCRSSIVEAMHPSDIEAIARYGGLLADPVERLRFARRCSQAFAGASAWRGLNERRRKLRARLVALESLGWACPGRVKVLGPGDWLLFELYWYRRGLRQWIGLAVACGLLVPLGGARTGGATAPRVRAEAAGPAANVAPAAARAPQPVWLAELSLDGELYSNGLRVLNDFQTRSSRRSYLAWRRGPGGSLGQAERQEGPAGIVYHTTESEVAPLAEANRTQIRQRGRNLLDYVRRRKLYNFLIDRFGRAWRIVGEAETAAHAGHSLWADGELVYFNLNESFIGVAFEARTEGDGESGEATSAQLYTARLLTEMLRGIYGIAEGNCVSHDLVSVNPAEMLIGYHTDWGGGFPYPALGLSNLYERPPPSVAEFGFGYDTAFVAAMGGRIWPGIAAAEAGIEKEAARQGVSPARHRRLQQQVYRRAIGAAGDAGRSGRREAQHEKEKKKNAAIS